MASGGGHRYRLCATIEAPHPGKQPFSLRRLFAAGRQPVTTELIIELPEFDTGQFESCEFVMSDGGARLTVLLSELPAFKISFSRVRWHQFTALPNCTAEMVKGAYFRLVELKDSSALTVFIERDRATAKAYRELHHYRIFLDETGCHELFAQSARRLT